MMFLAPALIPQDVFLLKLTPRNKVLTRVHKIRETFGKLILEELRIQVEVSFL